MSSSSDFSFTKDFSKIYWGPTLQHNLMRCVAAGLVWATLALFSSDPSAPAGAEVFVFPVALAAVIPIGLVANLLATWGIPFIGIISFLISLLVVVGDPILYLLHKIKPSFVPVEDPGIFNFLLLIFVLDEGLPDERVGQPEAGRVNTPEDTQRERRNVR